MDPRHGKDNHRRGSKLAVGEEVERGVERIESRCVHGRRVEDSFLSYDDAVGGWREELNVCEFDRGVIDTLLGDLGHGDIDAEVIVNFGPWIEDWKIHTDIAQ